MRPSRLGRLGTMLQLSVIRTDGGTQARAHGTDKEIADEWAQLLKDDPDFDFPAVECLKDPDAVYWLWDGFCRAEAYYLAGRSVIPVHVAAGTQEDAVLLSCGANAGHGQRRTPEDKRKAVQTLLAHPVWGQWSNKEIAARCKVSVDLVLDMRTPSEPDSTRTYRTKHGTTATMKVGKIGRQKPKEVRKGKSGYPCPDCPKIFDRQVWHCPGCNGHCLPKDECCPSCGQAKPTEGIGSVEAEWMEKEGAGQKWRTCPRCKGEGRVKA